MPGMLTLPPYVMVYSRRPFERWRCAFPMESHALASAATRKALKKTPKAEPVKKTPKKAVPTKAAAPEKAVPAKKATPKKTR